jgi:hypothetical protein
VRASCGNILHSYTYTNDMVSCNSSDWGISCQISFFQDENHQAEASGAVNSHENHMVSCYSSEWGMSLRLSLLQGENEQTEPEANIVVNHDTVNLRLLVLHDELFNFKLEIMLFLDVKLEK